jgi:hypothetical protein
VCVCPSVQNRMSCEDCELYMASRKRDIKFYFEDKEHVDREQNASNKRAYCQRNSKTPVGLCNCDALDLCSRDMIQVLAIGKWLKFPVFFLHVSRRMLTWNIQIDHILYLLHFCLTIIHDHFPVSYENE